MPVFIVKCRKVIVTDVEVDTNDTDNAREIVLKDIDGYMNKHDPTTVTHLISAIYRRDELYDHNSKILNPSPKKPRKKIRYAGHMDTRGNVK